MVTQSPIFQNVGRVLEKFGFLDVILPFVLIFTVVYAILRTSNIFDSDKANKIIAMVLGIIFVVPHMTGTYKTAFGFDPVEALLSAIPSVGFILIALVIFFILTGLLDLHEAGNWRKAAAFVSLIALVYIFLLATNTIGPASGYFSFINDPDLRTLIVVILVFALIVSFITSEEEAVKEPRILKYLFGGPSTGEGKVRPPKKPGVI